ncbi:site-specific integrase [Aeromonas veronii]|jgi:integrase|nr:site-specific integrase [Aeromonas veronii]
MASFKERAGGTVWVRVSVKIDGKFKQLTYTAANMEEAKLWAARVKSEDTLEKTGGDGMSVFELHNAYLQRNVAAKTKLLYNDRMRHALNWFGEVKAGDSEQTRLAKWMTVMPHMITPVKVEDYLRLSTYDFNTLRRDMLHMRSVLQSGGYYHIDHVKIGGEIIRKKRLITEDEYERLLAVVEPNHLWIIKLLFESGWRRKEIFELRPIDLRFGSDPLADFRDAKSGESKVRMFTESCQEVLMDLVAEHERQGKKPTDRLCPYKNIIYINQLVSKYRTRAGLGKHVYPHAFRHRFITDAQSKAGLTAREVMLYTGHTNINTVLRYTQADPELAREKMRRLNRPEKQDVKKSTNPDPNFFMK